ncbi:hypothetical protein RN001_014333, partial [Aquatica leii]
TYCVDRQVADSACSATAYLCGIKANEATIGVTAAVKLSDCAAMNNKSNHVYSVASLLQSEGKRTGLVTTTRVTHASPAGVYAHTANRNWEADTDIASDGKDPNKCIDIAQQLIHGDTGQKLNVIFGGGRYNFLPNDITDEDNNLGWRSDGRNLLQEWKQLKNNTKHKYIYNLKGLKNLSTNTKYVLGIFDSSHMAYNLDRDVNNKPSLSEMTKKAIEILSQGKKGFFLFVEGGRIDHAHHENLARKALDETIEFHEAVKTAVKMTDDDDTLIVVTSDHAHTMTLNGYPNRGNNILSIAGNDSNNLPYTTLSYANGPSAVYGHRPSITTHNLEESDYKYPSLVMLDSETHGGEDVAIFANGPWAHLFTGVTEQHVIPHILSEHYHDYIGKRDETQRISNSDELHAEFWQKNAKETIKERLDIHRNKNTAKNVILFLGDGMSITTLAAARTHLGQRNNKTGEETFLSFEKFPFTGLSKTYCVDRQVADSACSSTAYLGGVKANEGTAGVTASVKLSDCVAMNNPVNHVNSVAYLSQLAGKRTGIVTTTRVTHASPSGAYAHTANRDWESDADIDLEGKDPKQCMDIAQQLIYGKTGQKLNVIFGGGRYNFLPKDVIDEDNNPGIRNDSRNLIKEWKELKENTKHKYVHDLKGLKDLSKDTEYVLGLFDSDHMAYNLDRDTKNKPSLSEMVKKAVEILSKGKKGFFLFVEGGRIDHAHHKVLARKALDETIELHKAVETAVKMTDEDDTLIVVTSDHAHTMTLNGYPNRGNKILGIGGKGDDKLPYTTLTYANGPSATSGSRPNITLHNFEDPNYKYPSFVIRSKETHGGEDVGIFARGPWSHLFTGVTEQHVIPHIMSYASCVGDFSDCKQ